MLCKLSQDSILELRLISPSLNPTQENCPCCGQPFTVHQKQKSLRHVPWTTYNTCPRVRRTIRKSAVIGVIVSVTIPIILFGLTIYINDLMSNANKNKQNLADTVESKNKPISTSSNCTCSTPSSSECDTYCNVNWINDLYQNHRTKIKIFIAVIFLFFLIIFSITVLQYIVCVPKHQSDTCNVKRNISTPEKNIYSKAYISVQTQTLQDDLFAELGEYIVAKE